MEICKNCGSVINGKYCANCGQKVYTEKDKSLKHLLEEVFHFITHFEGKLFTSLKTILRTPGKLSVDYSEGIRQKYYKPISLYLLLVILYLIFPLFQGLNMEMKYYKKIDLFGNIISRQIDNKLIKDQLTEEQLAEHFHQKSHSTSKILLLLLIPLTAPIIYLLYFRRKRKLFDNFILATEINIFYLLAFYILFPILIYLIIYLFHSQWTERVISITLSGFFVIYTSILLHNVFKEKWWISILKGLIFVVLHTLMLVILYKTIVFEVTFALI